MKTKYMGKNPDINKNDLENLELFNLNISPQDISILKEKGFATENTKWDNPEDVLEICKKIIVSDEKDSKERLYLLGIILTHNKNEYIKGLKKEFYSLQIKIKRQREYIAKVLGVYEELRNAHRGLSKKYTNMKNKPSHNNSKPAYSKSYNQRKEDEIAWKKANEDFNKQFNNYYSQNIEPKKKIVIVKKKS